MSDTKITLPIGGGVASISDGTQHAPAIMTYEFWSNTQLSIARFSGGIRVNGHLYKMMDSGEPAPQGKWIPDLVREDWCSLYKKYRRGLKEYILKGMSPGQVRKLLKAQKDKLKPSIFDESSKNEK